MSHDWGGVVPKDMPTESIIALLADLRSGAIKISLDPKIPQSPEIERWITEVTDQMIAAYEREIKRRNHERRRNHQR